MVGPESQDLALAQNPVAGFQPQQVNARLIEISDNRTVESHSQPQETQDGPEIASLCDEARDYETESYDEENDGVRPLYPISLLYEVSRDPEGHREMLWPFWNFSRDHGPAWLDFRRWQVDNRGLTDDDDGFSAYFERRKRGCIKDGDTTLLATIEADPEYLSTDRRFAGGSDGGNGNVVATASPTISGTTRVHTTVEAARVSEATRKADNMDRISLL
ncbi:hypothetical protein NOR_03838 [Metarhizium rileyi]|uniref:Uncharacterized protein n=1 Tax=Metarhizium rileyi (strain RCEF 4871) TaxID=1649241 RepID=A0A162LSZ6_METRR|nr:hypothetical protein NOR_03838 [Metarhizium rileyi RCEF 4871]